MACEHCLVRIVRGGLCIFGDVRMHALHVLYMCGAVRKRGVMLCFTDVCSAKHIHVGALVAC